MIFARAAPRSAQTGDWRARVLVVALRRCAPRSSGAIARLGELGERAEVSAIVPAEEAAQLERATQALARELAASLPGFHLTVARSRWVADPVDLYRAGQEALLAANVAEADGLELLAFEDTGSYRLLLPAMSEDPDELERFYAETVAPLSAYDDQYETDLVKTVEAYLDNDGNVTPTADQLFTHRHTVRYRLERVKELCGHDITSTEGREKLGLGLKAMRVLGIPPPAGPGDGARHRGRPGEGATQGRGLAARGYRPARIGEWSNWQRRRLLVPEIQVRVLAPQSLLEARIAARSETSSNGSIEHLPLGVAHGHPAGTPELRFPRPSFS